MKQVIVRVVKSTTVRSYLNRLRAWLFTLEIGPIELTAEELTAELTSGR